MKSNLIAAQRLFVGGIFESAGQKFEQIHALAVYDLRCGVVGVGVARDFGSRVQD